MPSGTATRAEHGSGHQEGQGPQPPCFWHRRQGSGKVTPCPSHTDTHSLSTSQQGRDERWPVSLHSGLLLQGEQVAALVRSWSCSGKAPVRQLGAGVPIGSQNDLSRTESSRSQTCLTLHGHADARSSEKQLGFP